MDKKTLLLSNRVLEMTESAALVMAQKARELKSGGIDVIDMSLGEPDFDTPEYIKKAAKTAMDEGYTKYTSVQGAPKLREAICRKLKRDNQLAYSSAEIMVTNGAKQAIANVCMSLLNPGDNAILLSPFWVSYDSIIKMTGANVTKVKADISMDFKIDPEQLEQALSPQTKLLIFSSPCNPTGSVYTKNELEALAVAIAKYPNLIVISDEIYEYINFTDKHISIAQFDHIKKQIVLVNGFSKGFAMTGWRLGYMAAPEWLIRSCVKIQGQFTSGASAFGQQAGIHALDHGPDKYMQAAFSDRKELIKSLLGQLNGFICNDPKGAFYIFPDISFYFGKTIDGCFIEDAESFADFLLNKAHVSTVPGTAFGDPHCIRFSFATSAENIKEAVERIRLAVSH